MVRIGWQLGEIAFGYSLVGHVFFVVRFFVLRRPFFKTASPLRLISQQVCSPNQMRALMHNGFRVECLAASLEIMATHIRR